MSNFFARLAAAARHASRCLWPLLGALTLAVQAGPAPAPVAQAFGSVFSWAKRLPLDGPIEWQDWPAADAKNGPERALAEPAPTAPDLQVLRSTEGWQPWFWGQSLPTAPARAVWLRFQLPQTPEPETWYLRLPRNSVGLMTSFAPSAKGNGQWLVQRSGDWLAPNQWSVFGRAPIVELTTHTQGRATVYVKFENHEALQEGVIHLVHPQDLADGSNRVGTLNGLAFGVFSFLILTALLTAYITQQKDFYPFALMCFFMMAMHLAANGYTSTRLLPGSVFFNVAGARLLLLLTVAATAWYVMRVSYAKDISRGVYRLLSGIMFSSLLLALALLLRYDSMPALLMLGYGIAAALVFPAILWWLAVRRSQPFLKWMAWSLTLPCVAIVVYVGTRLGLLPHLELALFAGVVLTGLAHLGCLIAMVVNSRDRMLQAQRQAAMARTDAETGLANRMVALARMPKMLARSHRFGQPCGAMLVRWTGYQRWHGNPQWTSGGNAMVHLASRMQRQMREIDTVARIDKDRFLFLVEGPVSKETLNAVATRILSACMRPSVTLDGVAGFDLHMALWASATGPYTVDEVLEALDTRISQMSTSGTTRRVQFVGNQASSTPSVPSSGLYSQGPGASFIETQPPLGH